MTRRSAREQAFILLFEMSFSDDEFSLEQIKENAMDSRDVEFCDYAVKVAQGVDKNKDEIDEIISSHLKKGWKISRISKVSLAVLRLAIYEMKYEKDLPFAVSINEAVELSKEFSIDESGFVNGILGAVSRDLENN
ncbi:MAG: transcription antitermination factor NusB [Ruminococcus sp.]|nr:transcription antitermination factor NusB [Ruminococcus sp.]